MGVDNIVNRKKSEKESALTSRSNRKIINIDTPESTADGIQKKKHSRKTE